MLRLNTRLRLVAAGLALFCGLAAASPALASTASQAAREARPALGEARVERYTTYRLGWMRYPPSASRLAYRAGPASDILRCAPGP